MQQSFNEMKEGREVTPSGSQQCREHRGQQRVCAPWLWHSSCMMFVCLPHKGGEAKWPPPGWPWEDFAAQGNQSKQ